MVDEAVHTLSNVNEAQEYVVERLDQFARCRLSAPPPFAGLRREPVASLPLATPFGKVWLLLGVPKIGKTSVLQQLTSHYPLSEMRWFDVPLDADDCAEEIIAELKHTFTAAVVPPVHPTTPREPGESPQSSLRTIFVIDNANHLSSRGLRRLADALHSVRRSPYFLKSTCIFVSTMALPVMTPVIDSVVLAPPWSPSELGLLLQLSHVVWDRQDPSQYLDWLAALSGGHPLVALALARKYPDLAALLINRILSAPAPADEELSREVKVLLYEDILRDADCQNFVHRLSILLNGTPRDVLDVLRKDVRPEIATPTSLLLDRLVGSVIEGDASEATPCRSSFARSQRSRLIRPNVELSTPQ